jgi:hypothetical protein
MSESGLFGLVADHEGQSGLNDLAREVGNVARPISEAGSETVNGGVLNIHPVQNHFHRHIGEQLVAPSGENQAPVLTFL